MRKRFEDERGWLEIKYEEGDICIKSSYTYKGVIRGLHYQKEPLQQEKIIRVLEGKIIDLQVDMEDKNTMTYMTMTDKDGWIKIDRKMAHGFYTLEDTTFEYVCIGKYDEKYEVSYNVVNAFENRFEHKIEKISEKDKSGEELNIKKYAQYKKK